MGLLARREGNHDQARRELSTAARLLEAEDPARILLFGGGFSRHALLDVCRADIDAGGGRP
jgi:chemotaxis protein methyltransferase CheR